MDEWMMRVKTTGIKVIHENLIVLGGTEEGRRKLTTW